MANELKGYGQIVYIEPESTFGTGVAPTGSSGQCMNISKLVITKEDSKLSNKEFKQGRTKVRPVLNKVAVTVDLESNIHASGTAGTPPDVSDLLQTCFTETIKTGTYTIGEGSTVSNIVLADAATGIEAMDVIGVPINGELYPVMVVEIVDTDVSGSTVYSLSILPSLPSAPEAGDTIDRYVRYDLSEPTKTATIYNYYPDGILETATGVSANELVFNFSGGDFATMNAKCSAVDMAYAMDGMTLSAGVNDSVTSFPITGLPKGFNYGSGPLLYLQIGDEIVKVTKIYDLESETGPSLDVVRGQFSTTPASHLTAAPLTVYMPDATMLGDAIPGCQGKMFLGSFYGESFTVDGEGWFDINSATVTIDNAIEYDMETFGHRTASRKFSVKDREISIEVEGILRSNSPLHWGHNQTFGNAFIQAGTQAGNTVVIVLSNVVFEIPELSNDAEKELPLKLKGSVMYDSSDPEATYDDGFILIYF